MRLYVCASICLCAYLPMRLYASICLCVNLYMCLSVYASICLSRKKEKNILTGDYIVTMELENYLATWNHIN